MKTLNIQTITKEYGACVYASINVRDDYTMNDVVEAVKNNGYKYFRLLDTMKVFVEIR